MLSSRDSARPSYPFRFEVVQRDGGPSRNSVISVYDAWDVMMVEGEGRVELDLPRGLYTVRVTRAGELRERAIKHTGVTSESITEPMRTSAVPSFDTRGAHEYYSYTSAQWSTQDTRSPIGSNPEGRLFLFIRTQDSESYRQQPLSEYLQLFDEHGNLLSRFGEDETEFSNEGWLAFSAQVTPGLYLLTYAGDASRELPLYVFPGLSTQFFALYEGRLRLETASVLLQKKHQPFSPDDRETQAIDSALKGLQQGRDLLPPGMMQMFLHGKFDHPMLGLLGAHLLLLRSETALQKAMDTGLLETVIGNMDYLLPDSPDVVALKILKARRFREPPPDVVVDRPPMLRAGLDAVLALAAEQAHVIPEGSLLDKISARQLSDLPWTSWKPMGRSPENIESIVNMAAERLDEVVPVWVEQYIEEAEENAQQYGIDVDFAKMAADVGLPQRTIARIYDSVIARRTTREPGEANELCQIHGLGPTMATVLNRMGYYTLEDLAIIGDEELAYIMRRLGRYANRIIKDDWVGQAQALLKNKMSVQSS